MALLLYKVIALLPVPSQYCIVVVICVAVIHCQIVCPHIVVA